jgi:putative peptidoglycan lipid II flippase
MLISLGSIAINYVLNSLLVGPFGHVGLAFSTSAVALVNFAILVLLMRRRLGGMDGRRLGLNMLRICAAALPMAAAAWITSELASALPLHDLALRLVQVIAAIATAAIVFYLSCRLLRIEELTEAVNAIAGRVFRARRS